MGWTADFRKGRVNGDGLLRVDVKISMLEPSERPVVGKARPITKFKWKHVNDRVSAARQRGLKIAGAEIRRATQRSMSNRRPVKEKLVEIGTVSGERLVAKRRQIPLPDRVTSWKTSRFPKGFLRSDIQYDYDRSTDSVVVGPQKLPRLNRLHEIGGPIRLWFVRTRAPSNVPRRFSGGVVFGITTNRPSGRDSIALGTRRVKARRYMENGLKVAMPKIPEAFRDSVQGP
jgi:hypothetical protein